MRPSRRNSALSAAVLAALGGIGLWSSSPARAGTFYFDGDGAGAVGNPPTAGVGGSGPWDATTPNWWNGTQYVTWPNANPNADVASFRVAAGTVTIAADTTIYVNNILVSLGGQVVFQGGNANSVLVFSGDHAQVSSGANNSAAAFTDLTVNTGSGLTLVQSGSSNVMLIGTGAVFTGTGAVTLVNTGTNNYGARLNITSGQPGFAGGFTAVNPFRREALIDAQVADSLGTGPSSVTGMSRIQYVWGAQTPVGGVPVGVSASGGGVIDLVGSYASTLDRFIIQPRGVLRGSSAQLGSITAVSAFSVSPTGPEVALSPDAIIASSTNTSSSTVTGLGTTPDYYFGLGADFTSALFSLNAGTGTPWKGLGMDTQRADPASTGTIRRRISAGTITIDSSGGLGEFQLLTQGRNYSTYEPVSLWSGSGYNFMIIGNNTAAPTFALAEGSSAIPARIMDGSEVVLDVVNFTPAAFSKYVVSYTGSLVSSRSGAINGKNVDLEGGVLTLDPRRNGSSGSGISDSVGTLTVAGLSRLYVNRPTAGTAETLAIASVSRVGRAFVEVLDNAGSLGTDSRVILAADPTRGNIADPYFIEALADGHFLTHGVTGFARASYAAAFADGAVVQISTANANTAVESPVSADSIRISNSVTGAGQINLGVLPDASQAARAGLITTGTTNLSIAPAVNAGTSELVVYSIGGTSRTDTYSGIVTAGSLTQAGSRIMVLANDANAIGGPVTVWQGTLRVGSGTSTSTDSRLNANGDAAVHVGPLGKLDVVNPVGGSLIIAGLTGSGSVAVSANKSLAFADLPAPATFEGVISGAGGIVKSGTGTQILAGANTYAGQTVVAGGRLTVKSAAWAVILSGGGVDIQQGTLRFDYTGGGSPVGTVQPLLTASYNGAAWNVGQFKSTTKTSSAGLGWVDNGTTALDVRYTLYGDATLDGTVNFNDLLRLSQNYNLPGKVWADGDSNYDGTVNFTDLLKLSQNYNQSMSSASPPADAVPEPGVLAVLAVGTMGLLARRNGRRR